MDLQLTTCQVGGRTVVAVAGDVDLASAPELRDHLLHLISGGRHHLVVDLAGVEFMDSTGLAVLLQVRRRTRAHDGSLSLVCTREAVLQIFRITGLDHVFSIHDTAFAAVLAAGEARADLGGTDLPARERDPVAEQDAGVS